MTKAVNSKTWDLPVIGGRRYSDQSEPPSGEWADVYIDDIADIQPHMAVAGRTVGITVGSDFTGLGRAVTVGNGGDVQIVPAASNGSYNGLENGVKIIPPTALVGENAEYVAWLNDMNLWNGGAINIAQMNFRVCRYVRSRYVDLAPTAKCWGFQASTVLGPGGDEANRCGVYDNFDSGWSPYRYMLIIAGGGAGYYNPPVYADPPTIPDAWFHLDSGPDTTKLTQLGGTANHALAPPRSINEWICFEEMFDLRQNRGNPFGIHKLRATWRDGTVRELVYPLDWDAGWDFAAQYVYKFEGLGFYWNQAGTANADNYVIDCMPTFAANMGINDWIGPPDDFVI